MTPPASGSSGSAAGGQKPLALIGMMGSGKSSTARALAAHWGVAPADTDDEVEKAAGLTIAELIHQQGEAAFRECERHALLRVLSAGAAVFATGGGIILRADNRRDLMQRAIPVYLQADAALLWQRVRSAADTRPLLDGDGAAKMQKLLSARAAQYESVAAHIIRQQAADTPAQVAQRIIAALAGEC